MSSGGTLEEPAKEVASYLSWWGDAKNTCKTSLLEFLVWGRKTLSGSNTAEASSLKKILSLDVDGFDIRTFSPGREPHQENYFPRQHFQAILLNRIKAQRTVSQDITRRMRSQSGMSILLTGHLDLNETIESETKKYYKYSTLWDTHKHELAYHSILYRLIPRAIRY